MEVQSPINLVPTVRATSLLPLRLNWSGTSGFVHYGEHGTEVIFDQPNGNSATLGTNKYVLRQFHFHHPSEHFLDGAQFDGELHIVHQNLSDCSFFVLAIFLLAIEDEIKPNARKKFCDSLIAGQYSDIPTDPHAWLPDSVDSALRYEGSLTTPPYSETVSWVALKEPLIISYKQFGAIYYGDGSQNNSNHSKLQKARVLQPVNNRYVIEHKVKW
tara:strand:- start:32155 stop:32799 length:645 start_codon:yes stop_codon:yes gene_type:complete